MSTDLAGPFCTEVLAALRPLFGEAIAIVRLRLLPGGASKESWAVDISTAGHTLPLLLRRDAGGVIQSRTLSLEQEYEVLSVARAAGVRVPRPYGYLPDVAGRCALVMERVGGETIGRRIASRPELAAARAVLPRQMAEELAKIHAIAPERLPFLPSGSPRDLIVDLERDLDALEEPHPAIELGLAWLRSNAPAASTVVVSHGDYRIGNLVVGPDGLEHVLDWEFAHRSEPAEDLAWPLVRAWRAGVDDLRLGGIGQAEPFLEHYHALTGVTIPAGALRYWELFGNVRWAVGAHTQARRHLRGEQRNVELAILGRLAVRTELELLDLLERSF